MPPAAPPPGAAAAAAADAANATPGGRALWEGFRWYIFHLEHWGFFVQTAATLRLIGPQLAEIDAIDGAIPAAWSDGQRLAVSRVLAKAESHFQREFDEWFGREFLGDHGGDVNRRQQ